MTIDRQKEIADKVMLKLNAVDPANILAGGAPRNWYLGKEAKDLDFYVHLPQETETYTLSRWTAIGLELTPMAWGGELNEEYKGMPELRRVYEGEVLGMPIQVMVMNEPTYRCVTDKFTASVCQVWHKAGFSSLNGIAQFSFDMKIMYYANSDVLKTRHWAKMVEYFPDYVIRHQAKYIDDRKKELKRKYGKFE